MRWRDVKWRLVGQTPRSARVPLDPLSARRIRCLLLAKSGPGAGCRPGGRPHNPPAYRTTCEKWKLAGIMDPMALTWLVVGIGDVSTKRILPAILAEPHSRLAGIVTRHPAKAVPYNVPNWESLEAALAACPAEAVYIATPVFMHASLSIAALRAGRHVLCEKPMAIDYQQALTMQKAAEETGRTLGISYYRRMYPKLVRARVLMAAGA